MGLAAGDFDGALNPDTGLVDAELVLIKLPVVSSVDPSGAASASVYDFAADLEPDTADETSLPGSEELENNNHPPYVVSGRLDGSDRQEQVVTGWSSSNHWGLWVLSFNETLGITVDKLVKEDTGAEVGLRGVAIGRFDPPDIGIGPPPEPDFNQQIAVVFFESDFVSTTINPQTLIDIFTVDPPNFTPKKLASARTVFLDANPFRNEPRGLTAPLQAGDLQGRSLRLGPPEKSTVTHTQIETVLGMPPMHVDYITPPGGSEPEVYNVSVFPDVFNTSYQFTDSQNSSATSKSTTSYTYSTKESLEEKISYGVPKVASVSLKAKQALTQKHSSTVASQYDTYTGNSYTLDASTVFDDAVAFTTKRMNIYSYPVIGQMVCPAASPDCPADCGTGPSPCPKLPLHVQFSGVDSIVAYKAPVGASVLEWYQPVNEPGNLFSYPGNLAQLQANQPQLQAQGSPTTTPRFMQLSTPTEWSTSDDDTVALTWSTGSSRTNTVGSVSSHSFDASVSVSGKYAIGGFGLSGSAKFDYNNSSSVATLNSSTLTVDASDGVTLDLRLAESTNPNPRQDYAGASYIFGLQPPVGLIQSDVKKDPAATLPATGPLQVASVADMLSDDPKSSDWWPIAYGAAPDVALNHPQRWTQTLPAAPLPEIVWFNCPIGFTSSSDSPNCAASTPPANLPNLAAVKDFYQMKGLFVTPGENSVGPPTTRATRGDTLTLRARVYNYSLANMGGGTEVHVAFYAQPWDGTGGHFLSQPGNPDAFSPAVFIDEVVLAPIPAFCGGTQAGFDPCSYPDAPRNWVFAQTTWDTSTLPSSEDPSYWKFWVVTWMTQGGTLLEEIAGHGLTAIPGTALNSFVDVPIETYSNNLGFYNQMFALLPPSGSEAAAAPGATLARKRPPARPELRIKVRVSPKRHLRGRTPTVRAVLRSNQALDDVMVRFFDGDPAEDGVLFDVEMIPHIAARARFVVSVPYRQAGCDGRRLYVEAVAHGNPRVAPALAASRGHRACR